MASGVYSRLAPPGGEGNLVGVFPPMRPVGRRPAGRARRAVRTGFRAGVGGTAKAPIHRYRFPQETHLRGGEELRSLGGANLARSRRSRWRTARSTSRNGRTPQLSTRKRFRAQRSSTASSGGRACCASANMSPTHGVKATAHIRPRATFCCGPRRASAGNR